MKVPESLNKASGLSVTTPQTRVDKTKEKAGTDKPASDSVTLSSEAQALNSLEPDNHSFDKEKVERIKAALANPESKSKFINVERIADGVLRMTKDLLSAKGQ